MNDNKTGKQREDRSNLIGRREFVVLGAGAAAGTFLLGLSGCGKPSETPTTASYTSGTYTAAAQGKKGLVNLQVTFSEDSIDSIEVLDHFETPRISARPFSDLPEQIIEYQSLQVDTITGATLASMAVLDAVKDCVEQAGGDVATLEGNPGSGKRNETVEIDTEIVVLGAGASGMGTALVCAQKGLQVTVMEKCGNIGGNCLVSGGMMQYIEAPNELRAANTEGLEAYFESTMAAAEQLGFPQDILISVRAEYDNWYASGTEKVFDSVGWQTVAGLISLGIPEYSDAAWWGYWQYNAETIPLLLWLDNDMGMGFKPLIGIAGYPWPDWAAPTVGENGEGYMRAFDEYLATNGNPIEFLFQTPADDILMENGRAVGAQGTCADGTKYIVHASKAVVVATGGFSGSSELLREHDDGWGFASMSSIPTTNNFGHTGDGLKMALAIGATYTDSAPNVMCLPFVNAKDYSVESMVGNTGNALLLNKEGRRFVNESLGRNEISKEQMKQTDEMCWMISDKNNSGIEGDFNQFGIEIQQLLDNDKLFTADSLEDLSGLIDIDKMIFIDSIEQYNKMAVTKRDPEFGRTMFDETSPIKETPFYAFPCHWAVHITCCGLNVNWTNYALIDASGNDIPGLYGVGEVVPTSGGIMTMGNGFVVADAILGQ